MTSPKALTVHPYAELFPMMSDANLTALAHSIKANGLRHPIVNDQHGRLIDGRNRLRACEIAGVEPTFRTERLDDDPAVLRFVIDENDVRRHLDESQRAMVAAGIANMRSGQRTDLPSIDGRSISQPEAAQMLNVGTSSVDRASRVIKQGTTELQDAVKRGEIKVSRAAKIATLPKSQQSQAIAGQKKGGSNGTPKARKKAKATPPEPPDIRKVIREIRQMSMEALKQVCSTSSATWSNKSQHEYLNKILFMLSKFD